MIVFNLEPVFLGFYIGLAAAVGISLGWIARARLVQRKFNFMIVLGVSLILATTLLLFANPFEVIVTSSLVTLQIGDLEQLLLWMGIVITFAGIFRANLMPKRSIVGMIILFGSLFFSIQIEPRLGLLSPTSSPSEFNLLILVVTGVILVGGLLMALGAQEMKNAKAHLHQASFEK